MSTGMVLPMVWATGSTAVVHRKTIRPEMEFYREYTEALLGRYVRMSMEAGRVSSLLGKEMFSGNVTSYKVNGFDDVVIFVHDIERCLGRLDAGQQEVIARVALQRFTQKETAGLLKMSHRTVIRRYHQAIDCLSRIFLERRMLNVSFYCRDEGRDCEL